MKPAHYGNNPESQYPASDHHCSIIKAFYPLAPSLSYALPLPSHLKIWGAGVGVRTYLAGAGVSSSNSPLACRITTHTAHRRHCFGALLVFSSVGGRADASG